MSRHVFSLLPGSDFGAEVIDFDARNLWEEATGEGLGRHVNKEKEMMPDGARKCFPGPSASRATTGFRAIQKNAIILVDPLDRGSVVLRWEKRCNTPKNRWDAGTKARGLTVANFAEICAFRRFAVFNGTDLMHWSA